MKYDSRENNTPDQKTIGGVLLDFITTTRNEDIHF